MKLGKLIRLFDRTMTIRLMQEDAFTAPQADGTTSEEVFYGAVMDMPWIYMNYDVKLDKDVHGWTYEPIDLMVDKDTGKSYLYISIFEGDN